MTIKELRQKSESGLQARLDESHDKLREMRFKVAQRQLKKVSEIKEVKKEIARILTVLSEKKTSLKHENIKS